MNKVTVSSDSVADGIENPMQCPQCGAITRLDRGTCINCFLREGLEAKGEGSRQAFESILTEANVTDAQWRLGHYEILEEIGRGGMGVIYRARQQHSRRIVAVKRIFAHDVTSHETLVRFRREAEAVASLDHPNILPIYEVSESEEGLPFFSMKYATGGSLRTVAAALRTKPRECARLMAKVARGIAYAHSKGVLHRDLQPGNILLEENGEPMVSDFGLAKWLDQNSDLTRTLETLGTPGYIAPEQTECRAGELTSAADVYSLGAILFYLLTGRPPFVGPNVLSVIHQAAASPAPRLRLLAPSLDRDLETIVARCLESDPKARYQSAGALAEDFEHWLRHEPIRARRSGIFTHGRKWVRRNPTSTVLIAALVALAAAIVCVMVWKSESTHPMPPLSTGIAVLPFENLSTDLENAFFTDGMQDQVLNNLAKIANLKVISRTSVMQYKSGTNRNLRKIANELGVAHVVEGSVQRVANRVRVSAQLIDARNDTHVWAEHYDRPVDDVLVIQSQIAKTIADQLQAKLSPNEKSAIEERPTKDLAAYDLYVRAKLLVMNGVFDQGNLFEPARLLDQAIARDPDFFLAYCLLAEAHTRLYSIYDHTPARRDLADGAVKAALRLRPEAGEAHLARAGYLYRCNLDYDNARAELALAQHTLPNNAQVFELMGYIDRRQGRSTEALRNFEKALELDPHNLSTLQQVALTYQFMRRFAEAAATIDRAVALVPEDAELRANRAEFDLEWRADPKPLHKIFETMIYQNPAAATLAGETWLELALCERDPVLAERAMATIGDGFNRNELFFSGTFLKACVARAFGDAAAARKAFTAARAEVERIVLERPDEGPSLCMLGLIDAGLGRKEEALREGRRASEVLPVTKDAINGAHIMEFLGVIYAWTGEKDLAIKQIAATLQVPSLLSYGELRLHPFWDPLRGDPRFEKLVEEAKEPVTAALAEKSIAVLPFENLSTHPENAFFTDGVQDEILNDLAKIADLKVISRTSVMQYKAGVKRNVRDIANALGVAHVVEGSVQRVANRVRVSAQLIDARTDTHVWAEHYDRPVDDVFVIQSQIAKTIADQLQAKLSPNEKSAIEERPTKDPAAYDLYVRAKLLVMKGVGDSSPLFEGARLLDQAIARDSNFFLAYCLLAEAHSTLYLIFDHTPARRDLADGAVKAAVRLRPEAAEAHLARAGYLYRCNLDYDNARAELALAQRTLPNNSQAFELMGAIDRRQGRLVEGLPNFEKAVELDPHNLSNLRELASTYLSMRRFAEAAAIVDRTIALAPENAELRANRAWLDLQWRADPKPLHKIFEVMIYENGPAASIAGELWLNLALCERDPVLAERAMATIGNGFNRNQLSFSLSFLKACVARAFGDDAAARKAFTAARAEVERIVLERPDEGPPLCMLGLIDAGLGRKEEALREGRRASELTPVTKDAINGTGIMQFLGVIYAWTGERDLAIKQIAATLQVPDDLSYGELKLHPFWDPLRGDPRFEKLVEESKKPVALK